jgi:predicted small lipoprotein YifL
MAAMAAWTGVTTLTLAGCGLKGPLYLPQQKKTKTPGVATPGAPAPTSPSAAPSSQS